MIKKLDDKLDVEALGEIIGICSASKTAKEAAIKRPTLKKEAAEQKAKAKGKNKTKAQKKEEQKAHAVCHRSHASCFANPLAHEYALAPALLAGPLRWFRRGSV